MTQPLVTIITPTFNRPALFAECAAAVLAQTFQDWTWWVAFNCESWPPGYAPADCWSDPRILPIWFPVNEAERRDRHVPACIVNWIYPKVQTPYIYFLADDDLIDPDGLFYLVDVISEQKGWVGKQEGEPYMLRPQWDAVYGRCEVIDQQPDGTYRHACWCYDAGDVGLDTGISPHCRLDGGQVLHTSDLWRRATADGWQLTDSREDAPSNDGTLLARLAEFARFHYVPQRIVTHRRTHESTFHKPQVTP